MTVKKGKKIGQPLDLTESNVIRFTIKLPVELWKQAQICAIDKGYGARGINRWAVEAIDAFLERPETERNQIVRDIALQEVGYGETSNYGIRLEQGMRDRIWQAMMEAAWSGKDLEPPLLLEPTISMVIKAALIVSVMG